MIDTSYIAPIAHVLIGEWEIEAPVRFRVQSARRSPFDVAEVEIDNSSESAPDFTAGDSIEIWQGYHDTGEHLIFRGELSDVQPGLRVRCKARDQGVALSRLDVCQTWMDTSAQRIAETVIQQAGLTPVVRLSDLALRHRFVAARQNGMQLLRGVLRAWEQQAYDLWISPEGDVYCGPWEQSPRWSAEPVETLDAGEQLLDLRPATASAATGWCEALALPWLRHSQVIELVDGHFLPVPVLARIEAITYLQWPHARTEIEWAKLS